MPKPSRICGLPLLPEQQAKTANLLRCPHRAAIPASNAQQHLQQVLTLTRSVGTALLVPSTGQYGYNLFSACTEGVLHF